MAYSLDMINKMKGFGEIMKRIKLLAITLVLSLGFLSCSDTTLNGPVQDNNSVNYSSEYSNSFQKENPLNKTLGFSDNKVVTKVINGRTGGVINLSAIYKIDDSLTYKGNKSNRQIINVSATLIIPPGAFEGTREITLIDDYKTASLYCYPSMTFDKSLHLNLTFVGLDLAKLGFTTDNVKFGYMRADGSVDPCINDGITLNPLHGAVGVVRARIEHFSRYMFSR